MAIKKKHSFLRLKLIAIAFLLMLAVFYFDARIRPMIQTYASNQASNRVLKIVNESIYEELSENHVTYGKLVKLTYGTNGTVASLQTDMLELNRLQSSITQRIIGHVMEFDSQTIWVSLGSIIGGPIFSGRGPKIEIKLIPANFIQTKIANEFSSAGINQTRHQILMDINLTVTSVLPGYRSSTTINTNVVLAETIIVGNVPEGYTMVGDGTNQLVGMLQDYEALPSQK
ncbi:MAG: sporulation protein YunB [Angelakisella sp.]